MARKEEYIERPAGKDDVPVVVATTLAVAVVKDKEDKENMKNNKEAIELKVTGKERQGAKYNIKSTDLSDGMIIPVSDNEKGESRD